MSNNNQEKRIQELERELQKSKEQFQNIIERSIDGILIVDEKGQVRFTNPAACKILGRKKEEILGETFGFPLLKDSCTEIDILPKKQEKRIAEMRVVNTYWENKKAFLLSLRDITSQKKEERLRRVSSERAKKIQKSLFPKVIPTFKDMDLAGAYHHAENIGGDYFDIRPLDDGILLLMADVTGHGLDAALITIFLSTFFRRELELSKEITNPLAVLKQLQRDFFAQGFPDDYSLEVFLAFLSQKTRCMRYAAAGNIRALLMDENRVLTELPFSHGALINNTITHPLFGSHTITLSPNHSLLIYTDGVDEPFLIIDQNKGQKVLKKTIQSTMNLLSIEEMLERILGDMRLQNYELPQDDMAILALTPKKKVVAEKQWSYPPSISLLNRATNTIMKDIQDLPVDKDFVRMALIEAISNAMLHNPKDKLISIKAQWDQTELIISVEDQGEGFNWRRVLEERIKLLEAKERGRGLSIIEMTTQNFALNNQGNKIVMSWLLHESFSDTLLYG